LKILIVDKRLAFASRGARGFFIYKGKISEFNDFFGGNFTKIMMSRVGMRGLATKLFQASCTSKR